MTTSSATGRRLRRRSALALGAVALLGAEALLLGVGVGPASAAAAITVTPNTNLADQDTVHVTITSDVTKSGVMFAISSCGNAVTDGTITTSTGTPVTSLTPANCFGDGADIGTYVQMASNTIPINGGFGAMAGGVTSGSTYQADIKVQRDHIGVNANHALNTSVCLPVGTVLSGGTVTQPCQIWVALADVSHNNYGNSYGTITFTVPVTTTIPDTTIPDTTVPDTTVPDTTIPDTTIPDTTIPDTTVPPTTAPSSTTTPSTSSTVPGPVNDAGSIYATCAASGFTATEGSFAPFSDPLLASMSSGTYKWDAPWTSKVTPTAGGAAYEATLDFDFQKLTDAMKTKDIEALAESKIAGLGATAYLEQTFSGFTVDFLVPDGVTVQGTPTVVGTGAGAGATVATSAGKLSVTLPTISTGSYNPDSIADPKLAALAPFTVTVSADLAAASTPAALLPTTNTFTLLYKAGVKPGTFDMKGGVQGTQTCTLSATAPTGDTQVKGVTVTAASTTAASTQGTLPRTGAGSTLQLVVLALLLIDLGYLAVTASSRRSLLKLLRDPS